MLQIEACPPGALGRPTYDVVIPCYNRARTVDRAVVSVMAQSPAPERIIIVDDGSSDESAALLATLEQRHAQVQSAFLPRNAGASAARNVGLSLARAEWVAFLDSDDVWLPGASSALLAAAHGSDVVVGQFRRAWPDGAIGPAECGWAGDDILAALSRTGAIGPSWSIVRRTSAIRVGGFDPSFHNCNDWDFFVRVAADGARFSKIEETVAQYHIAAANRLSNDDELGLINAQRVRAHPLLARLLAVSSDRQDAARRRQDDECPVT